MLMNKHCLGDELAMSWDMSSESIGSENRRSNVVFSMRLPVASKVRSRTDRYILSTELKRRNSSCQQFSLRHSPSSCFNWFPNWTICLNQKSPQAPSQYPHRPECLQSAF